MTDLEPNVDLRERSRGRFKNKLEALWVGGGQDGMRRERRNLSGQTHVKRRGVLVLLLVDDAESEVNLVRLLEVWRKQMMSGAELARKLMGEATYWAPFSGRC